MRCRVMDDGCCSYPRGSHTDRIFRLYLPMILLCCRCFITIIPQYCYIFIHIYLLNIIMDCFILRTNFHNGSIGNCSQFHPDCIYWAITCTCSLLSSSYDRPFRVVAPTGPSPPRPCSRHRLTSFISARCQ